LRDSSRWQWPGFWLFSKVLLHLDCWLSLFQGAGEEGGIMIYGEIEAQENYCDFYEGLLEFIKAHFNNVESGLQGDAYICISAGSEKVSLDTFTSMNFEIKQMP